MSNTIDNRVVQMQFQNQRFQKNIKQTTQSLQKFKKTLDIQDSASGISKLFGKMNSVDLSGLKYGFQTVTSGITNLADKALSSIISLKNQAEWYLTSLGRQFTTGSISAGWDKLASKTSAVKTIMSATGKPVEQVNQQLQRLLWFTDETSYDFAFMTGQIGKFTALGKGLQTSVTQMQGIATWAALSGQNASTASRAMYNWTQAMGAGSMKLMDWKSIENAGMATQQFKKQAMEAAVQVGTLKKQINKKTGEVIYYDKNKGKKNGIVTAQAFATTLNYGWFNSTVMEKVATLYGSAADQLYKIIQEDGGSVTEALKKYAEKMGTTVEQLQKNDLGVQAFLAAQQARTWQDVVDATVDAVSTGWMTTFEYIIGNAQQATQLFTNLAGYLWEIFNSGSDFRNSAFYTWSQNGGRKNLEKSLYNILDVVLLIKSAFNGALALTYGGTSGRLFSSFGIGKIMASISENIQKATSKFKIFLSSYDNLVKLKRVFQLITVPIMAIKDSFIGLKAIVSRLFKAMQKPAKSLFNTLSKIGKSLFLLYSKMHLREKLIELADTLGPAFDAIGNVLASGFDWIGQHYTNIGSWFQKLFSDIKQKGILATLQQRINSLKQKIIKKFTKFYDDLCKFMNDTYGIDLTKNPILNGIAQFIKTIFGGQKGPQQAKQVKQALQSDQAKATTGVIQSIKNFFSKLTLTDAAAGVGIISGITGIVNGFLGLKKLFSTLRQAKTILKTGNSILNNFKSGGVKSLIFGDGQQAGSTKLTIFMDTFGQTLLRIAASVGIIVVSAYAITKMWDAGKIQTGLLVIAGILAVMLAYTYLSSKITSGEIDEKTTKKWQKLKNSLFTGAMAACLLALSISLKVLSTISLPKMGIAILGMAAIFVMLGAFTYAMAKLSDKCKNIKRVIPNLLALSISILIMTAALKVLSTVTWEQMGRGVVGLIAIVSLLSVFVIAMKGILKNDFKTMKFIGLSVALISMAAVVTILAFVVKSLGKMTAKQIIKGIVALGLIELMVFAFMKLINGQKFDLGAIGALAGIAGAIIGLKDAVVTFGKLPFNQLAKGVASVSILMIMLGAFTRIVSKDSSSMKTILSMVGVALAIQMIAQPIAKLGAMSIASLSKGIIAIGLIGLIISGLSKISNNSSVSMSSLVGIAGVVLGIIALSSYVITLGKQPIGTLAKGIYAVTLIGIFISLMPLIMNKKSVRSGALVGMAAAIAGIILLSEQVIKLGNQQISTLVKGITAMVLILGVISIFTIIMGKFKVGGISKAVASLIVMAGATIIMQSLAEVLGKVAQVPWQNMLAFAATFGIVMLSVAVAMVALGSMPISAIVKGALAIAAIGAALGVAVLAFGKIASGGIKSLGAAIWELGVYLGGFSDAVSGLNSETASVAISMLTDLVILNGQMITSGVSGIKLYNGVIGTFASKAAMYANALKKYDSDAAIGSTNMVNALTVDLKQVVQNRPQLDQLQDFTEKLSNLTGILGLYTTAMSGFKIDEGQDPETIGSYLGAMLSAIPKDTDIQFLQAFQDVQGTNYKAIYTGLGNIALAFQQYGTALSTVKLSDVRKGNSVLTAIEKVADKMSTTSVLWGFIYNESGNLDTLSSGISGLGLAMETYASGVNAFNNVQDIDAVTKLVTDMATLATTLQQTQDSRDLISRLVSQDALGKFSTQLEVLGPATQKFIESTSTQNIGNSNSAVTVLDGIADVAVKLAGAFDGLGYAPFTSLAGQLQNIGNIVNKLFNSEDGILKNFSKNQKVKDFVSFVNDIVDIQVALSAISTETNPLYLSDWNFSGAVNNLGTYSQQLVTKLASITPQNMATAIQNSANINTIMQNLATVIGSTVFTTSGTDIADNMIAAIVTGLDSEGNVLNLSSAMSSLSNNMVGWFRGGDQEGQYQSWYNVGYYVVSGMASGINENRSIAINAAKQMAILALWAAQTELRIMSPSRAFAELGMYSDKGFAQGMLDYSNQVTDASTSVMREAYNSAVSAAQTFADAFNEQSDLSPRITPVVDLTNLQNGMLAINQMKSIGNSIDFNRISSSIPERQSHYVSQDGLSGSDTIDALMSIENRLTELGQAITNMQIVMDSGALVGQIGGKVDNYIGQQTTISRRGV